MSKILESEKYKTLFGLQNLGNTCFINVILQFLFNTPQFINLLFSHKYKKKILPNSISYNLKQLYHEKNNNPLVFINSLISTNLHIGYQHDCSEFLIILLQNLHSELKSSSKLSINTSILNELPNDINNLKSVYLKLTMGSIVKIKV